MYYNYGYDTSYLIGYVFIFVGFIITMLAQVFVSSSYSKYKQIKNDKNITGFDVARKILDSNGLSNVDVVEVKGNLTDHYDPRSKVVRLSSGIYNGTSVAAVAVSAHECGHAIQDKEGYGPMRIRSSIVPVVNLCDKLGYFVIMIGFLFGYFNVAIFGFILLCSVLVFQLVTLPVEFNASKRAKIQINQLNMVNDRELDWASKMLVAAAMTYVASVINTLLQLLRLLVIILGKRRDD